MILHFLGEICFYHSNSPFLGQLSYSCSQDILFQDTTLTLAVHQAASFGLAMQMVGLVYSFLYNFLYSFSNFHKKQIVIDVYYFYKVSYAVFYIGSLLDLGKEPSNFVSIFIEILLYDYFLSFIVYFHLICYKGICSQAQVGYNLDLQVIFNQSFIFVYTFIISTKLNFNPITLLKSIWKHTQQGEDQCFDLKINATQYSQLKFFVKGRSYL